jgi:D-methionine transport system ATP-binding protein
MIELRSLSKTFAGKFGTHEALKDIDLTVNDGDIYGIIGVSGAGKSTLVRCINLLEKPSSGAVIIDGQDVTEYRGRKLLDLRSRIGMIFQDFSLFAQRNVLANVSFPLELRGKTRSGARKRAHELLELVGLQSKEKNYPAQLSGGQQQRVAIARALANDPKYLLCDEATSALDSLTTESILSLLSNINRELGVTIVMITHQMRVIELICNKVAVIDGAQIVERGETANIFSCPQQQITQQLLGTLGSALHPDGSSEDAGSAEAPEARRTGTR